MQIATDFEGGRIEVKATPSAVASARTVLLAIPPDGKAPKFRQWFAFEARGNPGQLQEFVIENAGECTWGAAFGAPYRVYASEDDENWFRVQTEFDGKRLTFRHTPSKGRARYAYSPPFSSARMARVLVEVKALIGQADASPAKTEVLGTTAKGGVIHLLEIGSEDTSAKHLWIIAQQHPGEPQAGFFVEGLIGRLVHADERTKSLLARARIHVVPRMNPDGCALANHRTNAEGIDLNREWSTDSSQAIEVKSVRERVKKTGAHFFLDVHGDEGLPYVFAQPSERHIGRDGRFLELENLFEAAMKRHNSDYQNEHRYPMVVRDKPNTAIAATWAMVEMRCLAMTLEMPFSDNRNAPSDEGWSPERSKKVGAAVVDALVDVIDRL